MITAGKLDRIIQLQKAEIVKDSKGAESRDYSTVLADCPASVEMLSGQEMLAAGQVAPDWDVICVIRWLPDITAEHQFVYEGIVYDILSVREIGRREGLEFRAKARIK